jgi:DtxR family Mn-dependent transcriptional regulator
MTSTVENYLKRILEIETRTGALAQTQGVSDAMGVTPGTVTTVTKHLAEAGYLEYFPRRGTRLTERGREVALGVLRRHRIIELFLVKVLGLDWSIVHEEAEALEHAVSPLLLDHMDLMLGHPAADPHGDPIPRPGARPADEPAGSSLTLAQANARASYRVERILDQSPDFLRFAKASGLMPGAVVRGIRVDEAGELVTYQVGGVTGASARKTTGRVAARQAAVGRAAAAKIAVSRRSSAE